MHEGGRRRIYSKDALEALASKPAVKRWLEGLADPNRAHPLYTLNRFVTWRRKQGLNEDPDGWVAECESGSVWTLTQHLQVLQDWVKSPELEGASKETRRKAWFRVRGMYEASNVPLPAVKLRLPGNGIHHVAVGITAFEYLEMVKKILSAVGLLNHLRSHHSIE